MTYKGKRPGGASAWQIAAVMFCVLIFMIALSTHTAAEITGTPPAQQIKAALLTSDLEPEVVVPEQQTDENAMIETALLARAHKIENCTVSHYAVCVACCGKDDGVTASGVEATPYVTVAVDPALIPLGSDVLVDYGDGDLQYYRADDTGADVKGGHIDLCVGSYDEAMQLGVTTATVYYIPPYELEEN